MKFKCEIDNIKTLKKGMKITLAIDDKQTLEVMKNIYNFMDKPIQTEFLIDADEYTDRMKQITPEQRKKIYAIYRDIANYVGESVDNIKTETKRSFINVTEWGEFSLANCEKELANNYIEFLIRLCFEMGIPLKENPAEGLEDIENYLKLCIEQKKCAICGRTAEIHHWDAIGMGRDRNIVDDSNLRKIALCRTHHTEAHTIGEKRFKNKYHVYGVLYDGQ